MPDITPSVIPKKARGEVRTQRRNRKLTRTNRALASKGILVNPGENIQFAIDQVDKNGGGVVTLVSGTHLVDYNITLPAYVNLSGEGLDTTIINFDDANFNISIKGTAGTLIESPTIKNMTIEESGNTTAAVDVTYTNYMRIDNVRFSDNAGSGLKITASQQYTVFACVSDNNQLDGFELVGDATQNHNIFGYYNCSADSNTRNGFSITTAVGAIVAYGGFYSCVSSSNTVDGFEFAGAIETNIECFGCYSSSNVNGYDINTNENVFVGCMAENNSQDGFEVDTTSQQNTLIGCKAESNTTTDFSAADTRTNISETIKGSTKTEQAVRYMKNTSGGSLAEGDVVTLKAAAGGNEVTTTTSQGDDLVFGMAMETITNNGSGHILLEGYTTKLKADGTTDIAIGDYLGTFTTAGIAMKAAAGDMAIAIALEAYTTNDSNGIIDALLVTPRKI